MKHHKAIRKFGRERGQRNALLKSLALSLILKDKIKTTEAKAKELRPFIEKLVTKSLDGTIASRKLVVARIGGKDAVKKLFDTIAPKYKDRKGGYTRIVKLPHRAGDASKMSQIEFI